MEKGRFQIHEEVLRKEGSVESEYCIEKFNASEARQEAFLDSMKDCVIIDDAIVEGVCVVDGQCESISNNVPDRVDGKASTDVLDNTKLKIGNVLEEKKIPLKNIQLKFQDKLQEKIRKHEKELVEIERKLTDVNDMLRYKVEECDMHEKEASALKRSVQLLEKDLDSSNGRLEISNQTLAAMTEAADESHRRCQVLESRLMTEENKTISLESQLLSAKIAAEDSQKESEEIARSTVMLESEVEKLQDQTRNNNKRAMAQEEEIKNLKETLKSAEVAMFRAELNVIDLMDKVKIGNEKREEGEKMVEQKERKIQTLSRELELTQKQFDEKTKEYKDFQDDLETRLEELLHY